MRPESMHPQLLGGALQLSRYRQSLLTLPDDMGGSDEANWDSDYIQVRDAKAITVYTYGANLSMLFLIPNTKNIPFLVLGFPLIAMLG